MVVRKANGPVVVAKATVTAAGVQGKGLVVIAGAKDLLAGHHSAMTTWQEGYQNAPPPPPVFPAPDCGAVLL